LCRRFMESAIAHRPGDWPGCDHTPGGNAHSLATVSLLSGIVFRDVWTNSGAETERTNAILSTFTICGRQVVRSLDDGELPREFQLVYAVRNPIQPRESVAQHRIRHAEDY